MQRTILLLLLGLTGIASAQTGGPVRINGSGQITGPVSASTFAHANALATTNAPTITGLVLGDDTITTAEGKTIAVSASANDQAALLGAVQNFTGTNDFEGLTSFTGGMYIAGTAPRFQSVTASSMLKLDASHYLTNAVAGTDYVSPSGNITGTASNVTSTVTVAHGGTGQTSLTSGAILTGNGTSGVNSITPGTGVAAALAQNTDSSSGLVTQTGGDGRYVQQSYSASNPTPTVTGGGTYPLYVLQTVAPKIQLSSIANAYSPSFFSAQYFIYGKTGGNATQSVKVVTLPFTPTSRLSLQEVDGRGGSGINCIQWNNSGANGGSSTSNPAFPNNGYNSIYFQLVWTTANITCSAGDTLVMCTTAGGTGGSQFTFTADAAVSSSSTVNIRAILNGATAPTTSDTVVYDQTTGLSYTTTYSKNSATNSSSFPSLGIVWPSINGSGIDVNYYCSNTGQEYLFNLYAF